jgi:hypothetical protein
MVVLLMLGACLMLYEVVQARPSRLKLVRTTRRLLRFPALRQQLDVDARLPIASG